MIVMDITSHHLSALALYLVCLVCISFLSPAGAFTGRQISLEIFIFLRWRQFWMEMIVMGTTSKTPKIVAHSGQISLTLRSLFQCLPKVCIKIDLGMRVGPVARLGAFVQIVGSHCALLGNWAFMTCRGNYVIIWGANSQAGPRVRFFQPTLHLSEETWARDRIKRSLKFLII